MRIVGLRIAAPIARLLTQVLEEAGFADTAGKVSQAIELQVTTEAPLTAADHEAILVALGQPVPARARPAPPRAPRGAAAAPSVGRVEPAAGRYARSS